MMKKIFTRHTWFSEVGMGFCRVIRDDLPQQRIKTKTTSTIVLCLKKHFYPKDVPSQSLPIVKPKTQLLHSYEAQRIIDLCKNKMPFAADTHFQNLHNCRVILIFTLSSIRRCVIFLVTERVASTHHPSPFLLNFNSSLAHCVRHPFNLSAHTLSNGENSRRIS